MKKYMNLGVPTSKHRTCRSLRPYQLLAYYLVVDPMYYRNQSFKKVQSLNDKALENIIHLKTSLTEISFAS